jgi:hypothetical protein
MDPFESPGRVLKRELGILGTLRAATGLAWRRVRENPFSSLSPDQPIDRRERLSRKQVLPAILLYRTLKDQVGQARALDVTGKVIHAGAMNHLRGRLGQVDAHDYATQDEATRKHRVVGWLDEFFTATATVDEASETRVVFTVTACALNRLVHACGHPELAPKFCSADKAFFEAQRPSIQLHRPTTLATDDEPCVFQLHMGDS